MNWSNLDLNMDTIEDVVVEALFFLPENNQTLLKESFLNTHRVKLLLHLSLNTSPLLLGVFVKQLFSSDLSCEPLYHSSQFLKSLSFLCF